MTISSTYQPRITVITATYNAEKYLEESIKSVIRQGYKNCQYIIVDGGSTDKTTTIIKQYEKYIDYWISEPDKGIYDAWNKAIDKSDGEWLLFIGADDELYPNALSIYVDHILHHPDKKNLEFISSLIELVDDNLSVIRKVGAPWNWSQFRKQMTTWHVAAFHAKRLFDKYGLFDHSYKISGDYELLLRPKSDLKASFVNQVTAKMRVGGTSDTNLIQASEETYRAKMTNGVISYRKGKTLQFIDRFRLLVRKKTGWKNF